MESVPEIVKQPVKWYLKPIIVVVAIFAVGPLAIPLIWLSPALKRRDKIILTVITVLLTVLMIKATSDLYAILLREFQTLAEVLK